MNVKKTVLNIKCNNFDNYEEVVAMRREKLILVSFSGSMMAVMFD